MPEEKLNIVNEDDEVIGVEEREVIHKNGLLHREIHVNFITPDKKIIFQRRALDKDTFPGLLDAAVGGHVEIGDSYEDAAVKEVFEETGLKIAKEDLIELVKNHNNYKDETTGKINHAFQQEFIYIYKDDIADLKIEAGKGLGFEVWTVEDLLNLDDEGRKKFIPYVYKFTVEVLVGVVKDLKI